MGRVYQLLLVLAPVVVVRGTRGLVGPRDVVEHEREFFGGRLGGAGRVDGVGGDAADRSDTALAELDGEEVLGGAVPCGAGAEELEDTVDDLVVAQAASEQGRRLVDALAKGDGLEGAAAGGETGTLLAGGSNGVDEGQALDAVLAIEAGLSRLPIDLFAVGVQVEVYGLGHVWNVAVPPQTVKTQAGVMDRCRRPAGALASANLHAPPRHVRAVATPR